jgi:hypothetical protein
MNNNKTHLIGAQNLVGLALCRPGGHLFGRDVGGDGAFGPLLVVVQDRDLRVLVGTRQDHLSLDLEGNCSINGLSVTYRLNSSINLKLPTRFIKLRSVNSLTVMN